jgi:hypothetical protein
MTQAELIRRIRAWLLIFIAGLVISGLTAFPLESGMSVLASLLGVTAEPPMTPEPALLAWIRTVQRGIQETNARFPFLAYGTDWLAFSHLVIAVAFLGPLRDPVRNQWVVTTGLIACAGVIPLALIAGEVRGIPLWWRLIDCSFGVVGALPLLLCRRYIRQLERQQGVPV